MVAFYKAYDSVYKFAFPEGGRASWEHSFLAMSAEVEQTS
jgi:hypothetical protein